MFQIIALQSNIQKLGQITYFLLIIIVTYFRTDLYLLKTVGVMLYYL